MHAVIGQYLDLDTFLHRLHPMTKFFGLICVMLVTLLFSDLYIYMIQGVLLVLLLLFVKMPLIIIVKSLWSVKYIFIFIFIFNILFLRIGTPIWQLGWLAIYPETFVKTLQLVFRLLLLTTYAQLLTLTTKPLDLTYAIEKELSPLGNIAHIIGMILAIALRFIPTLQDEASKILRAQQSRGARFDSGPLIKRATHLISLLIPLFLISFNRAETLAIAMELRGYDPDGVRTHFTELKKEQRDKIVVFILICYVLLAVIYKIFFEK
ncbi:energy-coupling factor transporter transmembrane protein EcfT [Erysipelotrichaceae bacterium]|nr:energy-coupling factor transporter transmembrane protein EcfT [Erysipelotrichaceae bacterium]